MVAGSFIMALWNRYTSNSIITAQNQLGIVNNFLLSVEPDDNIAIENIISALCNDSNTIADKLFISIYDENGELLFTNTTSSRNNNIKSYLTTGNAKPKTTSHLYYDDVMQEESIITTSYSPIHHKYVITECAIINNANFSGFLSEMSFKLLMLFFLILIAIFCIQSLHKHINNIARLREYIAQLSDDEDFVKFNNTKISNRNNIKNITEDLYTLFKTKIDIIKQHDIEREQAIHEEKAKLDSKRILANNLNHEIKTPIGIIIGYLDTLLNHNDISPKTQKEFLKKCLLNTQRLQNMVINIAVINRLEDGSNNISLEDVNIYEITNHARDDLKFTLQEHNITFKNELRKDTFIRANEMLLYNVLCNLIKNCCFYSEGTTITFEQISQNDDFITFSFRDNGKGTPEDALPRLFDRFYRVEKDKNSKSGTGLGLPIVKESITLCGGKIEVENHHKGGLEFKFSLPTA